MAVTPKDVRKNEAVATAIVQEQSKDISAQIGIHALGKLAEMMQHDAFVDFVEEALQHATTGQLPQEEEAEDNGTPGNPT